ncbi:MAG: gliding motility-associated C-terminal domain-containing protein [Bacteroidota bacterium]
MKRTSFLTLALCLITFFATAQATGVEICNNGIDDDGDGFIDCYDGSCANVGNCDGTFLGNDAKCQAKPAEFPKFTMTLDFSSPNETTNHLARTAVGDLDRDGIPEIVTMNRYTKKLYVLNGNDGSVKYSVSTPFEPQWEVAIANIDNDACGEIFTFGTEGRDFYLYSYSCDLTTQLWRRNIKNDPINFGIADFNGDGKAEVYAKDEIYDAKTGTRLIKSKNWSSMNGGPVAVDIDGDEDLELVVGGFIYSVNLGPGTADGGTLTQINQMTDYYIRYDYSATSVADYNLDGFLDVIASGSTIAQGKNTTIFFWDVHNNTVKTFFDNTAGSYQPNGWQYGTGRVNIADLDGDGKMNVSYVSGKFLYALDENLNLFWRKVINEETSGYTGCTLFDFNGDGKSEIVYRDEQFLYIINGTDGSVYNQQNCVSRTNREYPIVADVDADGSTEMCVPCGFNDKDAKDNFDDINYSRYSHIRVFKSAAEPWVPARRVWNQHGYFNVNVNDDLTIPIRQQKHHLIFSTGSCTTGPNRPLNGFLNQSPFLNSLGCPTYASPDLAYVDNSLTVNQPTCPEKKFTVSFKITNKGDQVLDGTVPITFYDGNPQAAGAVKLGTINVSLLQFRPGDIFAIDNAEVNGPGGPFTLFIVLNDNGSTIPTPITLPNTNFVECDYSNNVISAPVLPKSVPINVTSTKNAHCPGSTTPNNGTASASITLNGVPNTTDFNFYWFNGTTVDATPDFVGSTYSGIADGTYSVYAIHKTAMCNSDTAQVVVGLDTGPLKVTINLLSPVNNCKNPDGSLQAIADSKGQPVSAFTFAWYQGNDIFTSPQIGVSDIAKNLKAQTYTVVVTEKLSGCFTIESMAVPSNVTQPVVTTTKTDIVCSDANSGKVAALADGKTTGFKFEWYNGTSVKPTADYNGATQSGLPGGNYTVVATNNGSKCQSVPVTVNVISTPSAKVTATKVSDVTSCDPSKPNGAASASVVGGPTGFTFEWFKGTSLTAGNKIGTGTTISGLAAGTYTVRATQDATGCFDTDKIKIDLNTPNPTLSLTEKDVTTCTPYNGQVTATPSVDTPADYTYTWYNGTSVKATTDYPGDTDNVLDNLPPGDYTVQAVHKTKFCNAPPKTITVNDASPTITLSLDGTAQILPSDCNSNNGVMKVDVSGGSGSGFKIEWHFGRVPFSGPVIHTDNGVTSSTASSLKTGVYTVTATDLGSGCSKSDEFDLPFANAHSLDIVSIDDVTSCVPGNDGAVIVKLNKTPLPGFTEGDYKILVFDTPNDLGDGNEIGTINGVAAQLNYSTNPPMNLMPGTYTFVAVSTNPLIGSPPCRSVPKTALIQKHTDDPVVTPATLNANNDCAGAGGSGAITVSVDGGTTPANYTFEWFKGSSTTGSTIAGSGTNGESISNLAEDFYTVRVTRDVGTSTGCFSVNTYTVGSDPMDIDVTGAGTSINNLQSCSAATGVVINNGSIAINTITQDGASGNLADYTFEFTNEAGAVLQTGSSNTLGSLGAGNYMVLVTNINSTCTVTVPLAVQDMTIGTVGVDLTAFEDPERCIAPKDGRLTVTASGTSGGGYSFAWYAGATATGPVINATNDLTGINTGGLPDVTRTIQVINNSNNCRAQDVYVLPLIVNDVEATASSSPVTSCIVNDGAVFGAVTNDNTADYTYNWYDGTAVKATADHTGRLVISLPEGDYTLVAVDNVDSFCASPPQTVTILNSKVLPIVTTSILAPVSNCDPTKANGGATVSVNADMISFKFDWYTGAPITVGATPFFSGVSSTGLSIGTYSVRATNVISGCFGDAQAVIIQQLDPVPNPNIVVVSNVTSCVMDNGILSASVDGNTEDYIFNWYVGSAVKGTIDYNGEMVDSLAVGPYTVTATSRITGCTTGPDTDQIIKDQVYPDFDFKIIPASCQGDNGFASLVMSSNVPIESIEWNAGGAMVAGPNLENIGAGTYEVTVTSELGCSTTKDLTVGTEIRPYNGVSRNNDGKNDIFNIACIENFPNNLVKIYNRAGTMVYEGEGYNNVDIYFDGKSNRGVSPMGLQLPDGTYFYVIDKRDGSKPLAGYLELVK